jgi:Flp pilus assembly protein TadG
MKREESLSRGRGRRGQAMVEFALILPVFLLLVVGMLEFARAWNLHQVMTDAAREGARRLVLSEEICETDWDRARHAMWDHLAQFGYDPQYATMSYGPEADCKRSDRPMTVTLTLPYRFFVLSGLSITMRSSFTMRNE